MNDLTFKGHFMGIDDTCLEHNALQRLYQRGKIIDILSPPTTSQTNHDTRLSSLRPGKETNLSCYSMQSPRFPRSKSAPDITSPQSPIHSSNKSARSTGSPITTWPKKLGDFVTRKTKSSDLTEARLQEFNKRNALYETRYSSSSPYYKGLIDYTLVLNREKLSGSSPGRESHATTFVSSRTSFSFKIQEWGSCFTSQRHEKNTSSSGGSHWTMSSSNARKWTSSSSSKTTESGLSVTKIRTKKTKSGPESERKRVVFTQMRTEDTIVIPSTTEKSLRERDSEGSPMLLPLSPWIAPPPESEPYPLPQITPPTEPSQESLPYPLPQITPTEPSQKPLPYPLPEITPPIELSQEPLSYPLPEITPPIELSRELLPYPLPQITLQTALPLPSPPSPALLSAQSPPSAPPPAHESFPSPEPALQAPVPPTTADAGTATYDNEVTKPASNEITYTWADKYRPSFLQDFLCNKKTAFWLRSLVRNWNNKADECGNFIFEGKPGVGKRTMIRALLREAHGRDKLQASEEWKTFYLKGEAVASIPVKLTVSPQHIELNLSDLKGYEKHVIVELIKEESEQTDANSKCGPENCKAIILYEADKLCTDSLLYIKWMLEKFKGCKKVFFCCSDASKLQAIKPICTHVQLLEPSNTEILEVLAFIATKEGIQLPHQLADNMAKNSKNNLRQAIRSFEATWHFNGCSRSLMEDHEIKTGWENKIADIARNVIQEQSPKQLYHIRGELQNLIEHNVAPDFIFQTLTEELRKILHEPLLPQFANLYDEYQRRKRTSAAQEEEYGKGKHDHRKNDPVQQFMRIEEFIARFMSWYKGLVVKNKEA